MARLILGTAGHIDHGKTALVKALTGIDTDRLKEEKARGITIELGFADLHTSPEVHFGIVDVPGHEGFVRTMVAGASGMDVVLLVVAADEGVMPQTREHLQIVRLLQVPRLIVAVTKADLVEEEWMELVREDVWGLLSDTPFANASVQAVSARTGDGLPELKDLLDELGRESLGRPADDLARLPVDRAFTMPGAGTVVTGSVWSGVFEAGERVRLLPGDFEARIRGLQNHGVDAQRVEAGDRAALALTGPEISLETVGRGVTVVSHAGWEASPMLTIHASILDGTGWSVDQRQRVRVHLGTSEVLARAVLLDEVETLGGGEKGWVQLRLETPLVARVGDLLVLRSYSPMTTIGGGSVVEVAPPKRKSVGSELERQLSAILTGAPIDRWEAVLALSGDAGLETIRIPLSTGLSPGELDALPMRSEGWLERQGRVFSAQAVNQACETIRGLVEEHHLHRPLEVGMPVEAIRSRVGARGDPVLADAVLDLMVGNEELTVKTGQVGRSGFRPSLTEAQQAFKREILAVYEEAGLTPPTNEEVTQRYSVESSPDQMVSYLLGIGELVALDGTFRLRATVLAKAIAAVRTALAGKAKLGPAEFRDVLPVTRRHLLPILLYMDKAGVTVRRADGTREVPTI